MRLRDLEAGKASWHDAAIVCRFPPPGSPLAAALMPEAAWTTAEHLLALIHDLQRSTAWAQGGGKGERPKPIKRPGVSTVIKRESFTGDAVTFDVLDEWLVTLRAKETAAIEAREGTQ